MATVAVLDIALRAKTDKFRKGMKNATGTLGRFKSVVGKLTPLLGPIGLAGAAIAAAAAFKRLVIDSFATLDAIGKMSDRLGIATEDLAGFQLAAQITGVDVETMNKSLEKMAKNIGEAASETSELTPTLERMNLEATELVRKNPTEVFRIIAEKISNMATQAEKAAAANDFFGRSGIKLINVLDLGAEGIDQFIERAKRLGLALDREAIQKVEDANDAITVMKLALVGMGRELAVELAPAIKVFATVLTEVILAGKEFAKTMLGPLQLLGLLKEESKSAAKGMEELAEQMARVETRASAVFRETRTDVEKLNERMKELNALVNAGAISFDTYSRAVRKARQGLDDLSGVTRDTDRITREVNAANAAARRIIEETLTPQERYARGWERVNKLLGRGAITQEIASRKLALLGKELVSATEATESLNEAAEKDLLTQEALTDASEERAAVLDRQKKVMQEMEASRRDLGTFRQVDLARVALGGGAPRRQKQLVEDPQVRESNDHLRAIRTVLARGEFGVARTQ